MAEAFLSNLVTRVASKLVLPAIKEAKLWWRAKEEFNKLEETVLTIQGVLIDAEQQYSQSNQVRVWVDSLKQAFYDADDLLDDFSTEEVRKFPYSVEMVSKIKKIRRKLNAIAENRKFHLDSNRHESIDFMNIHDGRDQIHSSLPEIVIGRGDDKKKIMQFLLSSNSDGNTLEGETKLDPLVSENVLIVSIVGIGGLGKTTLAQLVFNDEEVYFELKLWVCISDNFDVKAIVEKILESIPGQKPVKKNCEMNTLKNLLHKKLNGKKYLLVLDDVWNENYEKWFRLRDLLLGGASGSRIIVTTRLRTVAYRIRSNLTYELRGLSEEESWSLFKQMAFKQGKVEKQMAQTGKAHWLHRLISDWRSFKDKELANIDEEDASILPTLTLSYKNLPSHLKCCFAYCSLYPKDIGIDVRLLVHRLVAQGYIKASDPKQSLEDIGLQYFENLLLRSFFQDVEEDSLGNIIKCKMHDLMTDLAMVVAGEEITQLKSYADCHNVKERTRHLSIDSEVLLWEQLESVLSHASKVRTLLLFNRSMINEIKEEQLDVMFSSLRRIRVLYLCNLAIERVPPSINKLKHIRYLDLSQNNGIEVLPDSITKLQKLLTLNLTKCKKLKQLPNHMKKLVNLRQLYITECVSLTSMPCGLGQLTSLQNLPMFVLAKDNGISKHNGGLDELRTLNLREDLQICNLQYVKNTTSEFGSAKLGEKEHLQTLHLAWKLGAPYDDTDNNPNDDGKEISLEDLQPHQNLKRLMVSGCGKLKFPSWVSTLSNLVELRINNCNHCQRFPPLDQFASLKYLSILNLTDLEYIESATGSFPSLEKLWLENCPSLKGWWMPQLLHFHCLTYLDIRSCPNLTSMPLIPSVETLLLRNISMSSLEEILKMKISVVQGISSSPSFPASPVVSQLKILSITRIEEAEFLPEELFQNLSSLQQLEISDCPAIRTLSPAIKHLTSLKKLLIWDCEELDFLDDENGSGMQWQFLGNLQEVQFKNMGKLVCLPKGLQHVTTLSKLVIEGCPNLMSLPKWMRNLTRLQYLVLDKCSDLSERCSTILGSDWPKIAHIPGIRIDGRWIHSDGRRKPYNQGRTESRLAYGM
ncbi:putative disease resistance protein RGA1 [Jatropha curcas]|nr:putative disease resistance protein RGA1 [Jatropha curcas]